MPDDPRAGLVQPPATTATAARDALVSITAVSKTYQAAARPIRALDNVDLEIAPREFVSVVGPSGCGKSTLLMLVSGLLPASAGEIRIRGEKVTGPYTDLGIVFQQDLLLDWRNVLGNVMLQCQVRGLRGRQYEERARELLDLVGLAGFEKEMPYHLSGGMRQRVSICRALVHDPPLLLLDEPFGALDALTRERVNVDLARIVERERKTVLFITHSIPEAVFLSDRVIVMSPRPGSIQEVIPIHLDRPRDVMILESSEFAAYANRIRRVFKSMGVL